MVAAWPGTINHTVLQQGFGEQPERNVISFPAEIGPPKERRRSSVATDILSYPLWVTAAEWALLKTFYRTTLLDGVSPFTFTDPLTSSTSTYTFMEAPKIENVMGLTYGTTLKLRRMP